MQELAAMQAAFGNCDMSKTTRLGYKWPQCRLCAARAMRHGGRTITEC